MTEGSLVSCLHTRANYRLYESLDVRPIIYALTRWAWALGIPLGISEEFLRQGQEIGL